MRCYIIIVIGLVGTKMNIFPNPLDTISGILLAFAIIVSWLQDMKELSK